MIEFDTAEVQHLAVDLGRVPQRAVGDVRDAVKDSGRLLEQRWRAIARDTAGDHGKHYPRAITSEMVGASVADIEAHVGPESARPQGGMSFEFGSRNQPPHLDGHRAVDELEETIVHKIVDAAGKAVDSI